MPTAVIPPHTIGWRTPNASVNRVEIDEPASIVGLATRVEASLGDTMSPICRALAGNWAWIVVQDLRGPEPSHRDASDARLECEHGAGERLVGILG